MKKFLSLLLLSACQLHALTLINCSSNMVGIGEYSLGSYAPQVDCPPNSSVTFHYLGDWLTSNMGDYCPNTTSGHGDNTSQMLTWWYDTNCIMIQASGAHTVSYRYCPSPQYTNLVSITNYASITNTSGGGSSSSSPIGDEPYILFALGIVSGSCVIFAIRYFF